MSYTDGPEGIPFKFLRFRFYWAFKNKLDSKNSFKILNYLRVRTEVAGNYVENKNQLSYNTPKLNVTIEHVAILILIQELPASYLCRAVTILLRFSSVRPSKCPWVKFEVSTAG
jgi:hypothetical protein